eukprot:gene10105-10261_t
MDCGCPEGQACTETNPGQLGICYLVDCPWSNQICGTSEKFGKCGVNLDSGCPGVPLNCPCANPSQVCPAGDGQLAVCKNNLRGTDGACVDVPAIPSSISNTDKAAVSSLIASNYLPYQSCFLYGYTDPGCCNLDAGFPGSVDSCLGNSVSNGWQEETRKMINLFRTLAGVPHVRFTNATRATLTAQAALVQAANKFLTHNPPASAACYSQDALIGSVSSNLATGFTGTAAVMSYIADFGDINKNVGHRNKLLQPINTNMASGDAFPETMDPNVFWANAKWPTNAIWVNEDNINVNWATPITTGAAAARQFVSWPPPGFIPHILVFPRWHIQTGWFSIDDRSVNHLASATVSVSLGLQSVSVTVVDRGFNYIVFTPSIAKLTPESTWVANWIRSPPAADTTYTVTLSGLNAAKFGSTSVSYNVIIYNLPGSVPPP